MKKSLLALAAAAIFAVAFISCQPKATEEEAEDVQEMEQVDEQAPVEEEQAPVEEEQAPPAE